MYKTIVAAMSASLLAGCATITSGTSQSVSVVTPHVENAQCQLTDSKGATWYLGSTPGSVTVHKGDGPMTVVCKKGGYHEGVTTVDEELVGATFGNILLGGGIGIFVDAASGAAQKYPDTLQVWMEPHRWASSEARAEWYGEKRDYERKLAEQNAAQQNGSNPKDAKSR